LKQELTQGMILYWREFESHIYSR